MSHVRPLGPADIEAMARLNAHAYPGFQITSQDVFDRNVQRWTSRLTDDESVQFYGMERDGELVGSYFSHSFRMNLLGMQTDVGGIGFVAVDFYHKKERIAKELLQAFVRQCRDAGKTLTMLYPFRPDFYKQMGWGFGTKMDQYRIPPALLPKGPSKRHVQPLTRDDKALVVDFYNRQFASTHGLCAKTDYEWDFLFGAHHFFKLVGVKKDGRVQGYMIFHFKGAHEDNNACNDMIIREFFYETPEALSEMMTFLHSQADQINRVVFHTQDEDFHHLFRDPRDTSGRVLPHVFHQSNVSGVGLMYRVVDTAGVLRVLADHDFGGQTCKLKLTIEDTFLPENASSLIVHVNEGKLAIQHEADDFDAEVKLDIADFSSLLVGAISFRTLVQYGLAEISDPGLVQTVHRMFLTDQKPVCVATF